MKVTELQQAVMVFLSGNRRTVREVANHLDLTPSRVEAILDALTKKGLVDWQPKPVNIWRLSPKGDNLLKTI